MSSESSARAVGKHYRLEQFIPRDQIDHLYVEAAYYLHPEGQLASDTVHALRLAMRRSSRVALGHIRIGDQERPALIEPYRAGLMMSTLYTHRIGHRRIHRARRR